MKNYDIYGSKNLNLAKIAKKIDLVLDTQFKIGNSYYYGGEYYRYGEGNTENFILQSNFNQIEQEWSKIIFQEFPLLLFVNNTDRADEIRNLFITSISELEFLKRREV